MARLKSTILVDALVRLATQKQGAAYVARKGSPEAGAIFIVLYDRQTRAYSLFEPTPQVMAMEHDLDGDSRAFSKLLDLQTEADLSARFESEAKFDPDFWVVELEGISQETLGEAIRLI